MSFKNVSILTAIVTLSLFMVLLWFPGVILYLFNLPAHESAAFISRRAAILFLGIGVLSWGIRDAEPSATRQAICLGLLVMMLGMATLGIVEFLRGAAGLGIVLAIVVELFLGIAYFKIWRAERGAFSLAKN